MGPVGFAFSAWRGVRPLERGSDKRRRCEGSGEREGAGEEGGGRRGARGTSCSWGSGGEDETSGSCSMGPSCQCDAGLIPFQGYRRSTWCDPNCVVCNFFLFFFSFRERLSACKNFFGFKIARHRPTEDTLFFRLDEKGCAPASPLSAFLASTTSGTPLM